MKIGDVVRMHGYLYAAYYDFVERYAKMCLHLYYNDPNGDHIDSDVEYTILAIESHLGYKEVKLAIVLSECKRRVYVCSIKGLTPIQLPTLILNDIGGF